MLKMGLFGNYAKEGPGVKKNEPQKKRFFYFFELYFRKFGKLMTLSLLYSLFILPIFIITHFVLLGHYFASLFYLIPILTVGPATAGATYVLRNFAREEPTFLAGDFFEAFRSNYKQSVVLSIIDTLFFIVSGIAISFYWQRTQGSVFYMILLALSITVLIIGIFMNFYLYILTVTVELKIKDILKNAFFFAVIGLKTNFITLFFIIVVLALFLGIGLLLPVDYILALMAIALLMMLFGYSTIGFIINFNAYPYIKKHCIDPYLAQQNEQRAEEGESEEDEESIFQDELIIKDPREEDEKE